MTALKREANQPGEQMPMGAFLELEKMLVPILPDLDYDKELAEARNEKYSYTD